MPGSRLWEVCREVNAHLAAMHGSVAVMVPMATLQDRGVGCNTYIQDKPSFSVKQAIGA